MDLMVCDRVCVDVGVVKIEMLVVEEMEFVCLD